MPPLRRLRRNPQDVDGQDAEVQAAGTHQDGQLVPVSIPACGAEKDIFYKTGSVPPSSLAHDRGYSWISRAPADTLSSSSSSPCSSIPWGSASSFPWRRASSRS